MRVSLIGVGLILMGLLGACSNAGDTEESPPGGNAPPPAPPGANGGGAGAGAGAGAGGASTGGGGTPAPPPAPKNTGSVTVMQTSWTMDEQNFVNYVATAAFLKAPAAGAAAPCKTSKEGACTIEQCDLPAQDGEPAKVASEHAGEITIAGAEEITLTPGENGVYSAANGQSTFFEGGADIKVTAKGDKVPAFDKTLKAPSAINLMAPEYPGFEQKLVIDSTKAFSIEWTDGTDGDVAAIIGTIDTDKKKGVTIKCAFPAKDGKGSIPAAAIGKLLKGAATTTYGICASSATTAKAGDWDVTLAVQAIAQAGSVDVQ
jgi:hypothetical protein